MCQTRKNARIRRASAQCNPAVSTENTAATIASRRVTGSSCGAIANTPPAVDSMTTPPPGAAPSITALASVCAQQLSSNPMSFADDTGFHSRLTALLAAVAASDSRFAFDRDGRPAALQAVRTALPAMEAELFDVILEDLACELAAVQEALYQVARAATSRDGRSAAP